MRYSFKIRIIIIVLILSALGIYSCSSDTVPVVTTTDVTDVTQTTAYSGGIVTSDGDASVTARGVCWNIAANPDISNTITSDSTGTGSFTSHLTELTPNTLYYVRAYATNSEGTAYGNQVSFTTPEESVPTVITSGVKSITLTTATGGGIIPSDGGVAVTVRGTCWNTTGTPTIADNHTSDWTGTGQFTSTLNDLVIGTTYYVRAYAINSLGTSYGDEVEFTHSETVTDIDGNTYSVVTIGTQIWMGENLKTTKFNDGTNILYMAGGADWALSSYPVFCVYNNESGYLTTFGALYNWFAVNTGNICPEGWHVPSSDEFDLLIDNLGGEDVAGGKLKETGTVHWSAPNQGATNSSGFTALPGGGRYNKPSNPGLFTDLRFACYLWSATEGLASGFANGYELDFSRSSVNKGEDPVTDGKSVRCIKDGK
jgi:uncharacterized protein (TIGR02145 family)